jgi:hypothetical protein
MIMKDPMAIKDIFDDLAKSFEDDDLTDLVYKAINDPIEEIKAKEKRAIALRINHLEKTNILLDDLNKRIENIQLYKDLKCIQDILYQMTQLERLLTIDEMKQMNEIYNRYKSMPK